MKWGRVERGWDVLEETLLGGTRGVEVEWMCGRGRTGEGGGGACSFFACLSYLTVDHSSLSRRGTVFAMYYIKIPFSSSCVLRVWPSVVTAHLLG